MYKTITLALIGAGALMCTDAAAGRPVALSQQPKAAYGPNIIRFTPVTVFDNSVGVGISYERILDKDGKIGIHIPVYAGLNTNNSYYNGWGGYDTYANYSLFLNPGVKFYPAGQRKVTYALGASLFTMLGDNDYYDGNIYEKESYLKAGIMINNSVHFNITPKFNLGLELGVGPSYINQYHRANVTYNDGIGVSAQFGFHMGFRF